MTVIRHLLRFSLLLAAALALLGQNAGAAESTVDAAKPPVEFNQLSPEAKAFWLKAEIKPTIPKDLYKDPPAEQIRTLETIGMLEAAQRADDKVRPAREEYRKRREAEDRAELVRLRPKGFTPKPGRKAKLKLIARSKTIKAGETFWYRLELQNTGSEPILFDERPSFWKVGNEPEHLGTYRFKVRTPDGKEVDAKLLRIRLIDAPDVEAVYPATMTKEASEQAFNDLLNAKEREASRNYHLRVLLQSGETLVTRPWQLGDYQERINKMMRNEIPDPKVTGAFRELALSTFKFDQPGRYRISIEMADLPRNPPSEKEIQRRIEAGIDRAYQMKEYREDLRNHLGLLESNAVSIQVLP